MDYKEYARQMRENAVINDYGQIICSPELWEQIASIIESTADVVPKSEVEKWFRECEVLQGRFIELEKEVAREIFEEIEEEIKLALDNNRKRLSECEFADDWQSYISGKLDALRGIDDFIAELKKKYTESEGKG
jgi:uncharacterized protein YbcC (UPF0753/DUF2309 family)